jgi:putative flippase GtrA
VSTPPEDRSPTPAAAVPGVLQGLFAIKVVRYVLVGGFLFLVDVSVFLALVKGAGVGLGLAQVVSRTAGAATGFLLHRAWTFAGDGEHRLSLPFQGSGFVALNLVNIAISPLVVTGVDHLFHFPLLVTKIVSEALIVGESFVMLRWIFRRTPG